MLFADLMNWTAESQLLSQETPNFENGEGVIKYDANHKYQIESQLTEAEMIEFISKHDDFFKPTLDLADLFQKEKDTVKKDSYGYKTVSLVAWIKRNNGTRYADTDYKYGCTRYNTPGSWASNLLITELGETGIRADFIKNQFHSKLAKLRAQEFNYFKEHDEYSILKKRWHDEQISNFGVRIGWCSDGRTLIYGENNESRNITIGELKKLLAMNQQVKSLIDKLTAECDIKY